jgi:hypothetical protein
MDQGSGKLPIIACVREAWLFLRDHWRIFIPGAIVAALVSQVGFALMGTSSSGDPGAGLTNVFGYMAAMLPALLASVMFTATVLRKCIRNVFLGPAGLGFGADELRLLAIVAAFACMLIPLGTLVVVIVTATVFSRLAESEGELAALMQDQEAMSEALASALGPAGSIAFSLLMLLLFVAAIYFFTRLFMVNAATLGERRVVMFQTWSWSRGNILNMAAAVLLTWLPAYLIDSLVLEFGFAIIRPLATEPNAGIVMVGFNAVVTFVALMVGIPSIVLGAIFYRGLRPADFVAK